MFRRARVVGLLVVGALVALTGFLVSPAAAQGGSDAFVTVWKTNNSGPSGNRQIRIPVNPALTYNYNVDCDSDGTLEFTNRTGATTCTYPTAGTYTVSITGVFPHFRFNNAGDRNKLIDVTQWGSQSWLSMEGALHGAGNASVSATDVPDLSNVTSMRRMFERAFVANPDVSGWDTSNVTNMSGLFSGALSADPDVSNWDTSSVTDMRSVFQAARAANPDVSNWDTSSATSMKGMFRQARSADPDVSGWDVTNVTNMGRMFQSSGLSVASYDALLASWSAQPVQSRVPFAADGVIYCNTDARDILKNEFNWRMTDAGTTRKCTDNEGAFVTVWKTDNPGASGNRQVRIPTNPALSYNYNVDCDSNGVNEHINRTGPTTCTYPRAGTYTVSITGTFPHFFLNSTGDKDKIIDVTQWGTQPWLSMEKAFFGARNVNLTATDAPDLTNVRNMSFMFADWRGTNLEVSNWDVSNVRNMSFMFAESRGINLDVSNWDVGNVRNMSGMFAGVADTDPDVSNWDVSNVRNMRIMFTYSKANPDVSKWDVSNVTETSQMFFSAPNANPDVSNWDVSNLVLMREMFARTRIANPDVSSWDVSNVVGMTSAFEYAIAANPDVSNWDVSSVDNMNQVFKDTVVADPDVSNWDVSNVTTMVGTFERAAAADPDVSNWDVSNVTLMHFMFNNSGLSTANYDALLAGWSTQTLRQRVPFGVLGVTYCDTAARATLTGQFGWRISDGGVGANCLVEVDEPIVGASDPIEG